jgi:hypothetical protein
MRPITRTYTTNAAQAWIPLDHMNKVFNYSVGIDKAANVSLIEYTLDNVQTVASPVAHGTVPISVNGTKGNASITQPVCAVRFTTTGLSASSVTVTLLRTGV